MTGAVPLVALVAACHRRLSHSPVYHGHLFPVDRFFPSHSPSTTTAISPSSLPLVTLPLLTSEINALSSFYQVRCAALRPVVDSLQVDLPTSDEGKADVAFAFALLLHSHHRDAFNAVIEDPLHSRVTSAVASRTTLPSSDSPHSLDTASDLALSTGVTAAVPTQLRRVLEVLDEVDLLRTFCLTSSMHAAAALALLDPPLSTPSPLLSSPFALSHHLTELNSTLQALLNSFLPRASSSSLCPVSSLTIALPVSLSCCHHRFELLSLLTSGSSSLTSDRRCPLCSHPIDLEADQLTADSALIYLAHDADTTPHDNLPPTLPTDLPQPVPSPVLTLSTMSDSGGGKGIRAGEEAVEQAASTATVTGMGVLGSSTAAPGAALPVGVQARGLLLPPPSSLQSASSDGDGDERGVSCHQCKSNKPKSQLLFCTTKSNPEGKKRRCRKKYCTTHSARTHTLHTAFSLLPFPPPPPSLTSPPLPTLSSPCLIAHLSTSSPSCSPSGDACLRRSYSQCISAMSADELLRWQCPSCASSCTCAACLRRGSRSSDSFTSPSSSTPASASTTPSHTPTPSQSSSTVASPSQRQPHLSSTPSSTPPIPLPPPNLLQSHFPLAMSGLPTPTRTHLPVSYPSPFHPFHHFSSHPPSPFHHPPPYLPPNPFGGYQFAVSPQFVMSGVAGGGRGGGVDMGGMGGMGGFKGGGGLVVTGLRNGYGAGASAAAAASNGGVPANGEVKKEGATNGAAVDAAERVAVTSS